jgi:2-oxoisovalerate dehydrogenase E1 component alpha subunit
MLETKDRGDVDGVPSPVRLLAQDGTATDNSRYHVDLEPDRHVRMLTEMIVTRRLDEEFVNLQRQGQLALFPPCRGQEAAQVGTTSALRASDWLFPQYRELGAFVVRGIDPVGLAQLWRGNCHGGTGFVEKCCAPLSIPIGTHALHAVGLAMGAQRDGDGSVAVAFIGDGATSEGDVHEALNMAAVFDAPCIFVVQNNQWAISVPFTAQTRAASIAQKAVAYGMPGVRCDGNDILACFAVMAAAVDRAREGGGPTLIEAVTYRMGAHTTSDDPTRYRAEAEVAAWGAADPIERYRRFLESEGIWTAADADAATDAAAVAANLLRAGVYDAPGPDPLRTFDFVLSEPTPALVAQREEFERELAEELH